jgi:transcriptional regulator with XRE-family HTH domain
MLNPFAEQLKSALEQKGWRQKDLVKATGAPQALISLWLNGKAVPAAGHERVDAVAKALGLDVTELNRLLPPSSRGHGPRSEPRLISESEYLIAVTTCFDGQPPRRSGFSDRRLHQSWIPATSVRRGPETLRWARRMQSSGCPLS